MDTTTQVLEPGAAPIKPVKKKLWFVKAQKLSLRSLFVPNQVISKSSFKTLVIAQTIALLAFWFYSPIEYLPKPGAVWESFNDLWAHQNLLLHTLTSIKLSLEALVITTLLTLSLGYLSSMAFFKPFVIMVGKLRFLSLVGLSFFFIQAASSDHVLKVSILVFSIAVFYTTSIVDVLRTIPQEEYDLARTLRMTEWQVMYEVVVRGQMDRAFDALRQNAAIGWIMLTVVEGLARSEGGIGTLLLTENKYFHLSAVLALQLIILGLGLAQDWTIGWVKEQVCPYAKLKVAK